MHFSRFQKKFPRAYITQQCTRMRFYFFNKVQLELARKKTLIFCNMDFVARYVDDLT